MKQARFAALARTEFLAEVSHYENRRTGLALAFALSRSRCRTRGLFTEVWRSYRWGSSPAFAVHIPVHARVHRG